MSDIDDYYNDEDKREWLEVAQELERKRARAGEREREREDRKSEIN